MTLQKVAGYRVGEDSDDLQQWLEGLEGCPPVMTTLLIRCEHPTHGEDYPTWFFVEGDAATAIARRRCLACGTVRHLLDSEEHWAAPPMYTCASCGQSMFEVGIGLHLENSRVTWLAVGVRCVGCGTLDGLTDMSVPNLTVDEVQTAV